MMKKIITAAAIGAFVATAPFAFAADNKNGNVKDNTIKSMNNNADPAATSVPEDTTGSINSGGSMMLSETDIGGWTEGNYRVVRLAELDPSSSDYTRIEGMKAAQPDQVAKTQAAIRANAALMTKLEGENVQIENIVSAEKAADGSVIFYLQ